jgi:integrase
MARGLTALQVERAQPDPAGKRREIPDRGKPGLYLIIQVSGAKSWAVRYRRHGDQRPRKYTLPGSPSLAMARKLGQEILDQVAAGGDPAADRKAPLAAAQTAASGDIAKSFHEYLTKHVRRKDGRPIRESTKRQAATLLGFRRDPANPRGWLPTGNGVAARWEGRPVASIRKADVIDLLDELAPRTPVMANRTLGALKAFFAWRMQRDDTLIRSPCAGISKPCAEKSRERVLSDPELAALWRAAEGEGLPYGTMVRLLVLSACRRDEIRCATWSEIDLEARQWLIPGARTKNGRDHLVPISEPMAAILGALPRGQDSLLGFPKIGRTPSFGLDQAKRRLDAAMARELRAVVPHWTLHDIRRTCYTGLQRLGVPKEINEAVVNHRSGTLKGLDKVYGLHDYANEKRDALTAWGRHVAGLLDGAPANVVALRAARS